MSGSEDDDAFLYGDEGDEEEVHVSSAPPPSTQAVQSQPSVPTAAVPLGDVPVVPLGSADHTGPAPTSEAKSPPENTSTADAAPSVAGGESVAVPKENGVEDTNEHDEEDADDGGEEYDDSSDEDIEITLSAPPAEAGDAAQAADKANEALNLTIQKDGGELKVRTAVTGSSSTNVAPSLSLHAEGEVDGVKTFDFDLDGADDKPWRNPGADLTDYFNYGFNEDTWRQYCDFQRANRMGMWKPIRDGPNGRGRNGDEVVVRVISGEREGPPPPPGARYGPPPGQYPHNGPPHGHMGGGRGMGRGRGPPPNMNDRMLRGGPPPGFDERFQGGRRGPPPGYDGPPPDNEGLQPERRRSRQPTPNAPGHHGNGNYGNNEYDPEGNGGNTRDRGRSRGRSRSRSPIHRGDRDGNQRGDRYNRGREDKRGDRHEDRPERTDRGDRSDRQDRGERSDRRERSDRGDRSTSNKDSRSTRESTQTRETRDRDTRGDKSERSERRSDRSSGRGERRREKSDRK